MPYKDPESQKRHAREYYLRNRDKLKTAARSAYWVDPEHARANRRAYKKAHPNCDAEWLAKHPEYHKRYHEEHRVEVRNRLRKWRREHPDAARLQFHRRRALKNGAIGTCTADQLSARIALYGELCWVPGCGKRYEAIDHVIALSKGGTNWPANLRPICVKHNSQKGTKSPVVFINALWAGTAVPKPDET